MRVRGARPPAVWSIDANEELLRLLDRSRDEVVDTLSLSQLLSVGGRIYLDTHVFPLLDIEGAVREIALDVLDAHGTRVPVLLSANVDPDGRSDPRRLP